VVNDKFRVIVRQWKHEAGAGFGQHEMTDYFRNFYNYCEDKAYQNGWLTETVANHELKPLGGRLIKTATQGWYLRWDNEASHTMFVLKWS